MKDICDFTGPNLRAINSTSQTLISVSFLVILTITGYVDGQEYLKVRSKVIPLVTQRSQIEKEFGQDKAFPEYTSFETGSEYIEAHFARGRCDEDGWNVPAGSVIWFRSFPKSRVPFEEAITDQTRYALTSDDIGTRIFTNKSDGVEFVVRDGQEVLDYIRFTPSERDGNLRCSGLPPYEPAADHYQPFQVVKIPSVKNWDPGVLTPTLEGIRQSSVMKGYISIYCPKKVRYDCSVLKRKVDSVAAKFLSSPKSRLTVFIGGYADKNEVKTFMLPSTYPPPYGASTLRD